MGIWGEGIFNNDYALDVENVFEKALDEGLNLHQASQRVLEYFAHSLEDEYIGPLNGPLIYLALAGLQMQYGDLQPEIRSRVLAILDAGGGMEQWEGEPDEAERQQVLEQFRWLLSTFPEPPETPRPLAPRPPKQAFGPGDLVRIPLPEGRMAFGRMLYHGAFGVYDVVSDRQEDLEVLRHHPYLFRIVLSDSAISSWRWYVIGHLDFTLPEGQEAYVAFALTGISDSTHHWITYQGHTRSATAEEYAGLEPYEVYEAEQVEERIRHELLTPPEARTPWHSSRQEIIKASQEHQARFFASEKASTTDSPEEQIARLRAYVEATLSQETREALGLDYGWHEAAAEPRVWFHLESLGGLVRCAIWFDHRERRWQVFIPNPYHPQLTLWDRELESELLAAIKDFWKVEGITPRAPITNLQGNQTHKKQENGNGL
jgi:hypothetical protein